MLEEDEWKCRASSRGASYRSLRCPTQGHGIEALEANLQRPQTRLAVGNDVIKNSRCREIIAWARAATLWNRPHWRMVTGGRLAGYPAI